MGVAQAACSREANGHSKDGWLYQTHRGAGAQELHRGAGARGRCTKEARPLAYVALRGTVWPRIWHSVAPHMVQCGF